MTAMPGWPTPHPISPLPSTRRSAILPSASNVPLARAHGRKPATTATSKARAWLAASRKCLHYSPGFSRASSVQEIESDMVFIPVEGVEITEVPDGRVIYQNGRERVHFLN